jgi:hypothetical protein
MDKTFSQNRDRYLDLGPAQWNPGIVARLGPGVRWSVWWQPLEMDQSADRTGHRRARWGAKDSKLGTLRRVVRQWGLDGQAVEEA